MPADGPAPLGAGTSSGAAMTKFSAHIYAEPWFEGFLQMARRSLKQVAVYICIDNLSKFLDSVEFTLGYMPQHFAVYRMNNIIE